MAVNLYTLEPLLRESITTLGHLRTLDFKNLNLKDLVTLVGLAYTAGKGLVMAWQLWKAVKQHGLSKVMRPNLKQKYGQWAVVTGCSRGVGAAYVAELAACGLSIVLVSRPNPRLEEFAEKIGKAHKVETCVVEVDFEKYENIYETIEAQLEGKDVGILMNNVGVGGDCPDYFLDICREDLLNMVNVNIIACTMVASGHTSLVKFQMTHMTLPGMLERGKGAVVIMASSSTDTPSAELAVYGATKSYLEYFSESLRHEYADQGITFQLLKPYFIADGTIENIIPGGHVFAPTPAKYARAAVATLGWSDSSTGYWTHTVQSWMRSLIPKIGRRALSGWINEMLRQANQAKENPDKPISNLDGTSFFALLG